MKLIRDALDETRELMRLEAALARQEVRSELAHTKVSALAFGGSASAAVAAFTMLMVALALVSSVTWLSAVIIAAILLCISGLLAFAGLRALPAKPMDETRERVKSDLRELKERVA